MPRSLAAQRNLTSRPTATSSCCLDTSIPTKTSLELISCLLHLGIVGASTDPFLINLSFDSSNRSGFRRSETAQRPICNWVVQPPRGARSAVPAHVHTLRQAEHIRGAAPECSRAGWSSGTPHFVPEAALPGNALWRWSTVCLSGRFSQPPSRAQLGRRRSVDAPAATRFGYGLPDSSSPGDTLPVF